MADRRKGKRKRISFDPAEDEIKKVIDEMAQEFDIPPGDFYNLGTLDLIEAIESGRLDISDLIKPSRLPTYENRLDLSERLKRFWNRRGK